MTTTRSPISASSLEYFKRTGSPVAALASAPGGPVAVLRISGKDLKFLEPITGSLPAPGTFELRELKSRDSKVLDRALVLFFKAPRSFTGEDVIEIQGHGVSSVVDSLLAEIFALGARPALAGEFSFRALLNDKMTLAEAEALQNAFAMEGLGASWAAKLLALSPSAEKAIGEKLAQARKDLATARGRVEAAIDFSEAEDEQARDIASARERILHARSTLVELLNSYENFCSTAGIPKVAIIGRPNAGKSTLLNSLVGSRKALVSPVAGTTRDIVEARLRTPEGRNFVLLDTAGLHEESSDFLEKEGLELGLEAAREASFLIEVRRADKRDEQIPARFAETLQGKRRILIYSHKDCEHEQNFKIANFDFLREAQLLNKYVLSELDRMGAELVRTNNEENFQISKRQGDLLRQVLPLLSEALDSLDERRPLELCGESLKGAEERMGKALGQGLDEEYLESIFRQFCLGK